MRIVIGWIIVTCSYVITLLISMNTIGYFLNEYVTKLTVGVLLILIPYILAGIYSGKIFKRITLGSLWVSLIPMICERVIIYLASLRLVQERFSEWNYITPILYIQKKVFYFTIPYIPLGLFSILVTLFVAKWIRNKQYTDNFSY